MQVTAEEKIEFECACEKIIDKNRSLNGIGTLGEKTLHAVIKQYIVPNERYHEIKCEGYVADILLEGEIIEIQTANFNVLRRKLDKFLPQYEVTIVYPIPKIKWLMWINEETGEITKKRKSPKEGSYYQIFHELYKIKMYLNQPQLHFRILLIDMEEYRLLNGWNESKKRGSTRYDRIPKALVEEMKINGTKDFAQLIPEHLPNQFTSKDYQKESKLSLKKAQTAVHVLSYINIIECIGKKGRSNLYQRVM